MTYDERIEFAYNRALSLTGDEDLADAVRDAAHDAASRDDKDDNWYRWEVDKLAQAYAMP